MSKDKTTKKKSSQTSTVKGKLDISRSGMAYVIVEGMDKDIVVRPNDIGRGFHGDMVKVQISPDSGRGRRTEGKVTEVVTRNQTTFIGNISLNKNVAFFKAATEKPMPDFYIPIEKLNGAADGERVVAKIVKWDKSDKKPEGEVVSILKSEDVNDMAMKEILIEAGFPLAFEKAVLDDAMKLSETITREELKKRKDYRDILTFTIDPVDAKDFDDAISIRNLDNGNYEIGVHIADVSHFVKPDSILDKSAYERATSVYLPDRVNPMLPEKISNELCSLRPNEDKYTFSVIFQITNRGEIKHKWIGRTIIHSNHRYTYEDVQTIIETKDGLNHKAILLLDKLAKGFRAERFEAGAINFSSQEVRFQLDEKGKPIGIVIKESKDAHKLVEEFMLLANRTIAEYVSRIKINQEPVPFPYRIHDTPDDEKLKPFAAFAKKFGYTFNIHDDAAVAASFNNLLKDVSGKPEQHVLEQLGIRTMAKAVYTSKNIGHYGLGFEHYCHFTSPIRRYPDVMVHRILQECLDKNVKPDKKMEEKCKHCSDRERKAMEAERASNKYKQVEFMMDYLGDEFDGIISGVASFGFFVETVLHKCEGMVTVRDLNEFDEFKLDDADYALVGMRTGKKFRMGDAVRIKVVAANLEKRQLDYHWVQDEGKTELNIAKAKKQTKHKK
ncbi:ribonuclease R [Ferruginibacter paludis]|uniref:ribonuclease R n=1 Tax=Ferruginibacter paludis TaxID=1310417 RepID=UPI0025B351C7|nr:ribonuclease R [Ferruginibacter paludis]MDN3654869.1 ribonuclease R [Ferruginibacter paludis]